MALFHYFDGSVSLPAGLRHQESKRRQTLPDFHLNEVNSELTEPILIFRFIGFSLRLCSTYLFNPEAENRAVKRLSGWIWTEYVFGKKKFIYLFFSGGRLCLSLQRSEVSFQPQLWRLHLLWNLLLTNFCRLDSAWPPCPRLHVHVSLSRSPDDGFDWESSGLHDSPMLLVSRETQLSDEKPSNCQELRWETHLQLKHHLKINSKILLSCGNIKFCKIQ